MRRYTVEGRQTVLGYPPGATFEADLDPDQEARLIARGSIKAHGDLTREQLDAVARKQGIDPTGLPNKDAVRNELAATTDPPKE